MIPQIKWSDLENAIRLATRLTLLTCLVIKQVQKSLKGGSGYLIVV